MLSNISYNQDLPQDLFHGQSYDPFIQGVHLEAICDCPTFMLGYFSDRSSNPSNLCRIEGLEVYLVNLAI